jgi:hypothetical protein
MHNGVQTNPKRQEIPFELTQTKKDGSETGLEVLQKMQDGLDLCEGLFVSVTGGAIEVAKSTCWLIDFI